MVTNAAQRLLILGTRTLAEEVADLVSDIPGLEVTAFVENMDRERCTTLDGKPVIWVDDLATYAATHVAVCALATTHRSRFTDQAAAAGMKFATIVHPTARVSARSSLGEGTIIGAGVFIGAKTRIGRHVLVNRGALIGHHTTIEDYTSVMPGANIAGNCRVGTASYIAIGAVIIDNLTVGEHSIVGAGALVTKDVPANVQVMGVPARIVKRDISGK